MKIPENVNWNHLYCFYEVGRGLSMTKAAKSLGITTPSVSAQVKALETSLGSRLLDRKTRRLEFTQEGKILFEAIRKVFEKAKNNFERVSKDNEFSSVLNLGLEPGWHQNRILEGLSQMSHERHGSLTFEIHSLREPQPLGAHPTPSRHLDAWVVSEPSGPEEGSRVLLFTEDYYFCTAKRFLKGRQRRSRELAQKLPIVLWTDEYEWSKQCLKTLFPKEMDKIRTLHSDFSHYTLRLLQKSPSLGFLPLSIIQTLPQLEALSFGKVFRKRLYLISRDDLFTKEIAENIKKTAFSLKSMPLLTQ